MQARAEVAPIFTFWVGVRSHIWIVCVFDWFFKFERIRMFGSSNMKLWCRKKGVYWWVRIPPRAFAGTSLESLKPLLLFPSLLCVWYCMVSCPHLSVWYRLSNLCSVFLCWWLPDVASSNISSLCVWCADYLLAVRHAACEQSHPIPLPPCDDGIHLGRRVLHRLLSIEVRKQTSTSIRMPCKFTCIYTHIHGDWILLGATRT
jgi:hypothetical protein